MAPTLTHGARARPGRPSGVGGRDERVDRADEAFEHVGELDAFVRGVRTHQVRHQAASPFGDLGVARGAGRGDRHHHDPTVVDARAALGEPGAHETLDGAGGGGRVDAQRVGEVAHPPAGLLGQEVEGVHLALFERVVAAAEEVVAQRAHRRAATQFDPGEADAHGEIELFGIGEIDRTRVDPCVLGGTVQRLGGRHAAVRVPNMSDDADRGGHPGDPDGAGAGQTPLEMVGVLATQDVMLTPTLRHVEMFSMRGLLTLLWHEPVGVDEPPAALVLCGGAMGGLLGPADGLYHRLGVEWAARGVPVLRVSYRRPNDLDACCIDVAAAVQLAIGGAGAQRVVVMGHSFGGAVAVRVAVGLEAMVAGVVTFATQSAGCEVAGGLAGRPLLMFHGERDEILPIEASEMVRMIAGTGELVRLPGDGHLLAKSGDAMWERLEEWLPTVLGMGGPEA
jgi:predicted alpha/beta-hydrolase family hydrolase